MKMATFSRLGKTSLLAASALMAFQASAVETDWGRLNLSYLNYDGWGGTYRIAGTIQDRLNDGHCLFMRVHQFGSGLYDYPAQTRVCSAGPGRYFDFNLVGVGGVYYVNLYQEHTNYSVNAWQRY